MSTLFFIHVQSARNVRNYSKGVHDWVIIDHLETKER